MKNENMQKVFFLNDDEYRDTGYHLRETTIGIVLERYFKDSSGKIRDYQLEEFPYMDFEHDIDDVIEKVRRRIKRSPIYVDWDPEDDPEIEEIADMISDFIYNSTLSIEEMRERELVEEEEDGLGFSM